MCASLCLIIIIIIIMIIIIITNLLFPFLRASDQKEGAAEWIPGPPRVATAHPGEVGRASGRLPDLSPSYWHGRGGLHGKGFTGKPENHCTANKALITTSVLSVEGFY